ncbi:MAG: cobyrinate a,c-diamide synthase, partial [Pseudomonadota bacterium]
MTSLYISATHKSSGKTTVTSGLCAALKKRGQQVQPFKKGPDYIDPIWLQMAAQQPCYNLDFFVAGRQQTLEDFYRHSQGADISIIEGNKGLYDGLDLDGSNSNAALANALKTPVILVVDARGTMRGIAPLLMGYQAFDKDINIAGVIANMTGGTRHEDKLRAAVEHCTDIPFLGAIGLQNSISIEEKHLGLVPGNEDPEAPNRIKRITEVIENSIDLSQLVSLAGETRMPSGNHSKQNRPARYRGLKIAIARDRAFGFYYQSDLDTFQALGAELIPFDTLADSSLPPVDGLFIGGGFPERYAAELSAN